FVLLLRPLPSSTLFPYTTLFRSLSAFGIADFQFEFFYVYRSVNIIAYNALRNNDRILEVVTLPGHVSHQKVTAECQLAILCGIALAKRLSRLYALTFANNRRQVDAGILVRSTELDQVIRLELIIEAH